jgi:hypothetical protein
VSPRKGDRPKAADHDPLTLLPQDLRAGDRFTEVDGTEWEFVEHPVVMLGAKHRAQVRRADDPTITRETVWPSYRRDRPTPELPGSVTAALIRRGATLAFAVLPPTEPELVMR